MIFSSGIMGKVPANDALPPDAASQARFAFQNLRTLLEQGGAALGDVGRVTVYIKDNSVREALNAEWLKCFPDPHDRPARHTLIYALPGAMHSGFAKFAAFDQDVIDNRAWLAAGNRLKMPVYAIGGEKSFGPEMAVVVRAA